VIKVWKIENRYSSGDDFEVCDFLNFKNKTVSKTRDDSLLSFFLSVHCELSVFHSLS
jgi:hypothetical protein